jgi:hypothetical protein
MYYTIKKIGDYVRNIFNPYIREEINNALLVYKKKPFSNKNKPKNQCPLTLEDVIGKRRKYNNRLVRQLLEVIEKEGKSPEKLYAFCEDKKTYDALYNLLKGRTYIPPLAEPKKPVKTLNKKIEEVEGKSWLSWALLPAFFTACLSYAAQKRTGVPLDPIMENFKDIVAIVNGGVLTPILASLGAYGLYNKHTEENLNILKELRRKMDNTYVLW